ncbi:MAG: hypothetical protein ABSA46_07480 [Thermodesulfovibrionales bacterium]|jgi:hypothetical protein
MIEFSSGSLYRVTLGLYASIGIEKGKPFAPDARMKQILIEAAAVGDATARAVASKMRQQRITTDGLTSVRHRRLPPRSPLRVEYESEEIKKWE